MAESYRLITPQMARQIRLIMTDVDGTLTSGDGKFAPVVTDSLHRLEEQGIIVGLVSGRELLRLEGFAGELNISGPLIGENGAVARMKREGEMIDLGFSQEPALRALEKLKGLFPDAIEAGEWNKLRTMDLIVKIHGLSVEELKKHLEDADILDSGYVLHLVQKGVSKGKTLTKIIGGIGNFHLSPDEVMVFGDAPTDLSLFQSFSQSVLVVNPDIPAEQGKMLREIARYISDSPCGEGFAEVAFHIIRLRNGVTQ